MLGVPALLAVWFSLGKLVTEVRETELSIYFHLLWIELRSGESVMVGSQRADELADAIGQRIGSPGRSQKWDEDEIQP